MIIISFNKNILFAQEGPTTLHDQVSSHTGEAKQKKQDSEGDDYQGLLDGHALDALSSISKTLGEITSKTEGLNISEGTAPQGAGAALAGLPTGGILPESLIGQKVILKTEDYDGSILTGLENPNENYGENNGVEGGGGGGDAGGGDAGGDYDGGGGSSSGGSEADDGSNSVNQNGQFFEENNNSGPDFELPDFGPGLQEAAFDTSHSFTGSENARSAAPEGMSHD